MKKITGILVAVLFIAAGTFYFLHRNKPAKHVAPPVQTEPVKAKPVPVRSKSVAAPEPSVTSGYVIGILSVSKSINGESIGAKVTNDSGASLQLDPDAQFKLVGLSDQKIHEPISAKTTAALKGEILPNASRSGTILFDSFSEEQSELRFYPDAAMQTYIVVPLIPLPEDQR